MPVIDPRTYQHRTVAKKRHRWPIILLLAVALAGGVNYLRPLPSATIRFQAPALPTAAATDLQWPTTGQAAVGAEGFGVLSTYGQQTPIATASIAKVITALCVLQKQPLDPGQSGPTYTIGPVDMNIYGGYIDKEGSLVPVALGETLTERQALEALMLPSANNIADSLANWVFKGQTNYAAYAQDYLAQHGITHTTIGTDASGFDPSTISTASDLVQIGLLALQNPTLMAIASEKTAILPVAGTVYNYNTVLGTNGITGLKTGNSQQNPGAFLFTAAANVNTQSVRTVGVVLGIPSLNQALQTASNLAGSIGGSFTNDIILPRQTVVGSARTAWGIQAKVVTDRAVGFLRWKATPLTERQTLHKPQGLGAQTVGSMEVQAGDNGMSTPIALSRPLSAPSFWWRLTRH